MQTRVDTNAQKQCFGYGKCNIVFVSCWLYFITKRRISSILVFPHGCSSYDGLNDVECYKSIWLEAGCIEQGTGWPGNIDIQEVAPWSGFTIE